VYCWSMPHLIHVFVSIAALLLFALMAGMFTLAEMGRWCRQEGMRCSLLRGPWLTDCTEPHFYLQSSTHCHATTWQWHTPSK
jgi:hypothetical protein